MSVLKWLDDWFKRQTRGRQLLIARAFLITMLGLSVAVVVLFIATVSNYTN